MPNLTKMTPRYLDGTKDEAKSGPEPTCMIAFTTYNFIVLFETGHYSPPLCGT
jgi:hypothetical protein